MAFYNIDAEDQLLIPTTGYGASLSELCLKKQILHIFLA